MKKLRETKAFIVTKGPKGIRITAKERSSPQSKLVTKELWEELATLEEKSFHIACVWDLGIGVWSR